MGEEGSMHEDSRQPLRNRHEGGGQERSLLSPGLVQDQDPHEAGNQGWKARDLWQGSHGEGEAREEDCEGFSPRCSQGKRLNSWHRTLGETSLLAGPPPPASRVQIRKIWVARPQALGYSASLAASHCIFYISQGHRFRK